MAAGLMSPTPYAARPSRSLHRARGIVNRYDMLTGIHEIRQKILPDAGQFRLTFHAMPRAIQLRLACGFRQIKYDTE